MLLCAKLADPTLAGAICDYGPVATGAAGMSAGHGPLRAAHDCSLAVAVELRWTCDPHSSTGGQR